MNGQAAESGGGGSINITQLPLEQLEELRKQLQVDVNNLSVAHESLLSAQTRFLSNCEVLSEYQKVCEAARASPEKQPEALLCISSALYASGRIVPSDRVLVDVGTDYFLEKSMGSARSYFAGRSDAVRENIEALEQKIRVKRAQLAQVVDTMRGKQAALQQTSAA
ncbi:putative prefoldin [Trypanosoma cruzi]|uniref:Prefoldin, putative n=2 Tax=Trypanosoma cruzi TaxID=5693 RepID=Q4DJ99_TRYCC|nr:prefoldin, putative [Trypanosoma cruzi]EAN92596.1 prefoldin, putative [Trypanosoma cruzi]PWV09011.1 putative prefoldin [Trypanosoma cruzi]RNC49656.1 prefoldin [Trypanosoma cruzi]|eukprot:XP_814447.1 prefoldin [Trypanosoma cruzi strain CL Brener]